MKTLHTQRLTLRLFESADLFDLFEYAKMPGVGELAGWPHHENIETSKTILDQFIKDQDVYAIVLTETNKVIGSLGVHNRAKENYRGLLTYEIGYVLAKDYWYQGLMTEAVKAVIKYLFEKTKIEALLCGYFEHNERSKNVIHKVGFKHYQDILKETRTGQTYLTKQYILTKNDWLLSTQNPSKNE